MPPNGGSVVTVTRHVDFAACDDVAWFSEIETLFDFCATTLAHKPK